VPKLGVFSGAEIVRIMEAAGFICSRQRGSHMFMQKRSNGGTITVPVPLHGTVRIGTLQSIIRQSGMSRDHFLV
jgi:predicted RNA binding protein YcfA (HicA-like mRNA interferase family)